MPPGLDHKEIEQVKDRLRNGDTLREIADEFDVSHTTIKNYKDEMQEEMELEDRVKTTSGPTIEDVRDAADSVPGIGDSTLDALEEMADTREKILQDPDELYKYINELTDLKHDWIDHIVKSTFPHLDGPNATPNQGQPTPGYYGGAGGQPQQTPNYTKGGQPQSPPSQQPDQGPDPQTREEINQLRDTVNDLAEVVKESQSSNDGGNMIEVETEDGRTVRAPPNSPVVHQAIGNGSDDDDFLDKIRKAQEQGVLPKPGEQQESDDMDMMDMVEQLEAIGVLDNNDEELVEVMSEQFNSAVEQIAKTQQMTADQISAAMEEVARQEQQSGDDSSVSREDVEEILQEQKKKDKIDKLESKFDTRIQEIREAVQQPAMAQEAVEKDPEYAKADREYQFKENQLEAVNQNIDRLLSELPVAIREGVVPAVKALDDSDFPSSNPLWSPPTGKGRGPPSFQGQPGGYPNDQQPQQGQQPEPQQGQQPEPEPDTKPDSGGESEAGQQTVELAQRARENLGLDDEDSDTEANA